MFDFNSIIITDEDIQSVESRFGFSFNEGQKRVIKYLHSTDIQACPGSGKTTTLAAKLLILKDKVPSLNKKGICIITHTNVAVEEIKNKLGSSSEYFVNYPNHLGTIQSFVDKYIAIPAYKNEYKHSLKIVDPFTYYSEINKFNSLKWTASFLSLKGIEEIGSLSFNRHNFQISRSINDKDPFYIKGISAEKYKVHYDKIQAAKISLLKEGIIKYGEAYSLAFKYLRENPGLKVLIRKRFPIVFIDEMQDMETQQSEIINLLFNDPNCIIQKIGDKNQAIYSHFSDEKNIEWKPIINTDIQLIDSTRLSQNIVQVVKDICISPQEINGGPNKTPLKPAIIVYDDDTILEVKDKFGELIIDNNLHNGKPCKAVGARISESALNINSYWNEFNRASIDKDFANINSIIEDMSLCSTKTNDVKEIRKLILNTICKSLRICGIKHPSSRRNFTPYTIIQYLNSLDEGILPIEINYAMAKWIRNIADRDSVKCEIIDYISKIISHLCASVNKDLEKFYNDPLDPSPNVHIDQRIYRYTKGDQEVKIHFDTIFGVKGETHQATLYLETYTRIYDIGSKILDFIISSDKDKSAKRKTDAYAKRLPLAYVAMTRATHFICLAVHENRFTPGQKLYFDASGEWDVYYLKNGISNISSGS